MIRFDIKTTKWKDGCAVKFGDLLAMREPVHDSWIGMMISKGDIALITEVHLSVLNKFVRVLVNGKLETLFCIELQDTFRINDSM